MDIPAIYQYYPSVPLSDLSDLYSPGNNTLANKKICIISALPKTLRINQQFPFKNTYTLFLEDITAVDSIEWEVKVYRNGAKITAPSFIGKTGENTNRYTLEFHTDVVDPTSGFIRADKIKVICKVKKGREEKELSVEHRLIKAWNAREAGMFSSNQTVLPDGDPATTNYMVNHLNDLIQKDTIVWNERPIHIDVSGENTLMKIVMGIVYNVLETSEDHLFAPPVFYDLNKHRNYGVENLINKADVTEYDGPFTAGISRLPLHLLSDVLGTEFEVPDYNDITSANKVYSMIVYNQALTVNTVEDDFLMTIPAKIQDSKERLAANKARTKALYHFAQFPKAAITLTALFIKYLFECSRKNECKDFEYSFITWPHLGFDSLKLKENQDFLRYTLTHYFNGPANLVDDFAERAMKVNTLVWSPAVYTVVHAHPRIVTAYFAKRVVKRIDVVKNAAGDITSSEFIIDLERIDSSAQRAGDDEMALPANEQPAFDTVLGKEIFLVVETLGCRGKSIKVNVKPGDTQMSGDTNPLSLWNHTTQADETDLEAVVGNFNALRITGGAALPGTVATHKYTTINHKDNAIFRIALRNNMGDLPFWQAGDAFRGITGLRDNMGELVISVKRSDDKPVFFGNALNMPAVSGEFLSANDKYNNSARMRVANYVVYEIYHPQYPYRISSMHGEVIETIGRINNIYVRDLPSSPPDRDKKKVTYYFHDALGNEHNICTTISLTTTAKVREAWNNTIVTGNALNPAEREFLVQRHAGEKIDAIRMRFFENGTYVEGRAGSPAEYLNDAPNAWRWYRSDITNFIDLVDADILHSTYSGPNPVTALNYERGGVRIRFDWQHTRRRWGNPDVFAGILGALQTLYERDRTLTMTTAGMAFEDASCYPSTEHVNGEALDSNYFAQHNDNQEFINQLWYWGFRTFRVGAGMVYNHATADGGAPPTLHTSHLHTTHFDHDTVKIIA